MNSLGTKQKFASDHVGADRNQVKSQRSRLRSWNAIHSLLVLTLLLDVIAGCRGGSRAIELAPPESATAKQVLADSLEMWKQGHRQSGVMTGIKPKIGIVDSTRGERGLKSFEIIGPLTLFGKARPFAVRLELENPPETTVVRYFVLGNDPLWIYRDEDFERTMHWEHKMPKGEDAATTTTSPTTR